MGLTATAYRPGAVPAGKIIATRRPARNDAAPQPGQYRKLFPVGVVVSGGLGSLISTWTTHTRRMAAAGFDSALHIGEQPWREDGITQGAAYAIDAEFPDGSFKFVPSTLSNIDATGDKLNEDWYPLSEAAQTTTLADDLASRIIAAYDDRPCVLAYMIGDDVVNSSGTAAAHTGPEVNRMATAFRNFDTFERPAFATFRDDNLAYSQVDDENLKVLMYSVYPVNMGFFTGFPLADGDFKVWKAATSSYSDFVDALRVMQANAPAGSHFWWHAQAHTTIPASNPTGPWSQFTKDYPSPNEMRLMFWQMVGEGIKGIFWFTWDNVTDPTIPWLGLEDPGSANRLAEASSLARRLRPSIRQRLLRCTKEATDRFTASGGGSAGNAETYQEDYPNAYISTLRDAESDVYYVVLSSHSDTTASITISGTSGFTTGTLTNLETHAVTAVGSAVTRTAFDGGIWMWTP